MSNSGAKAALKGYRLQTLYTLVEILDSSEPDIVFQPEGKEDLAIQKNNELIRVIQVKARNEKLSLSTFSPEKKDSFFHRASDLLRKYNGLSIEVISFGEIGSEIDKAWSGGLKSQTSIIKKLTEHGIDKQSIDSLFEKVKWIVVSEQELYKRLKNHLIKTMLSGDPDNAFSLLNAWLYYASEHQEKITQLDLVNKINAVGKYLSERAAHHKEWFVSINPLVKKNIADQKESLANEFYKGVSSRFSHIQAGLDTLRIEQTNKINKAFQNGHKTVVVHGASGQGKTTLAYRYLYDFVPDEWRFEVNFIENKSHAATIALAIADHLSVFKADLYLYIDVSPNEPEWTALVKSLLDQPNIKILVTIREEDVARQNISNLELGFPESIPLFFNKSEAKTIYQNLTDKKVANTYPSFTEAWSRFGGDGALMEYIYFLTQTNSLKEKLNFQVKRLREEIRHRKLEPAALEILFCCAVATVYESRVQISALVNMIHLSDASDTFQLFEDEYLIRTTNDKQHVTSLHPLRSKLLVEVLTDSAFNSWINAVIKVLPCILETDLENFLLYAFAEHPQEYPVIYQQLTKLSFHTWQGYAGVGRAIIWHGIYAYIEVNKNIIEQARTMAGNSGWKFLLNPDVAKALDSDPSETMLEIMGKNNPNKLMQFKQLRSQVSSSDIIFQELINWFNNKQLTIEKPINEAAWLGFSEILFWLGWLNISVDYDTKWLLENKTITKIPTIKALSQLTLSLYHYKKTLYQEFISKNEEGIEHSFQIQSNTLWLERQAENPIAHYIIPMYLTKEYELLSNDLNKESVYRAEILRKLFPEEKTFGAKGFGHQVSFMELPHDKSNNPGILKSALPISYLVDVNSTYSNLSDYNYRDDNWKKYTENIMLIRQQIVDGFVCINQALIAYFKQYKPHSLIGWKINGDYLDKLSKINMTAPKLPKSAVDQWGHTSEVSDINDDHIQSSSLISVGASIMLQEYKVYLTAWNDYLTGITNFFGHSGIILSVNGHIGRLPESQHHLYFERAEEIGHPYSKHNIHLSVVNINDAMSALKSFQYEFRNKFYNFIDSSVLKKLEEKERGKIENLWSLWYQFAHHPDKYWKQAPDKRALAVSRMIFSDLLSNIKNVLKKSQSQEWHAKILSDTYYYEEKPALWINLDLQDFSLFDTAYAELTNALANAIRPIEYKDLKYFVLTNHWYQIVIIPMLQGKTISNLSWRILSSTFVGNEAIISESDPWKNMPLPLPETAINHFKFEPYKVDMFDEINALSNSLGQLLSIIMHLSNFIEILPNLNRTGEKILENHLSGYYEKLSENISTADSLISDLKTEIKSDDTYRLEALEICENSLYPYGKQDDNRMIIQLGDCKEWALLLQHALEALHLIKCRV